MSTKSLPKKSKPAVRPRTAKEAPPMVGAHMSVAGGFGKAIDRALSAGCATMQVFVKNNMQWFAPPVAGEEIRRWNDHPGRRMLRGVFGHTGYLINLAATDPANLANSRRSLREELVRADALGLPFLVLHPGAHMGAGEARGLKAVAGSIDAIFAESPGIRAKIALENTAGQGSCLGHRFGHLAEIIGLVTEPDRLRVCVDTAHLFAAGYDISTEEGVAKTFAEFDRVVGKKRLVALHLNDSKTDLGSRVDRHEHIGKGKIGLEPFRWIMRAKRFADIPKVLETPKGPDLAEDRQNLAVLRSLV